MMKVFLVNDTTKIFRNNRFIQHFGSELVIQTFREQLDRVGIELIGTSGRDEEIDIPKNIDLVVVNGEGTIHNGKNSKFISKFIEVANHHPSVLVNSIWQNNPNYPALYNFKYIAVRESLSYKNLPSDLPNAEIVPDIMFSSTFLRNFKKLTPNKDLGFTDTVLDKKNKSNGFSADQLAAKYIPGICEYKRLCIGRFHGIIAASVLQIPFSAWPSNTHKIQGMLIDMQIPHLHFSTKEEALQNVPTIFDDRIRIYVEQAQLKIDQMFENLHNLV